MAVRASLSRAPSGANAERTSVRSNGPGPAADHATHNPIWTVLALQTGQNQARAVGDKAEPSSPIHLAGRTAEGGRRAEAVARHATNQSAVLRHEERGDAERHGFQ